MVSTTNGLRNYVIHSEVTSSMARYQVPRTPITLHRPMLSQNLSAHTLPCTAVATRRATATCRIPCCLAGTTARGVTVQPLTVNAWP
jgi:hypothetical protein